MEENYSDNISNAQNTSHKVANSVFQHTGTSEIEDINKISLIEYYNPKLNQSFVNFNDDCFQIDIDSNKIGIQITLKIYDEVFSQWQFNLWDKSLGDLFETYRILLKTVLIQHDGKRHLRINCSPVFNVFYLKWYKLYSLENTNSHNDALEFFNLVNNAECAEEVIQVLPGEKTDILKIEFVQEEFNLNLDEIWDLDDDYDKVLDLTPTRGDDYPFYLEGDRLLGKYSFKIPYALYNDNSYWVVQVTNSSYLNYSALLSKGQSIEFNDDFFSSLKYYKQGEICTDRPQNKLLYILSGDNKIFHPLSISSKSAENDYFHIDTKLIDNILAEGDVCFMDLWMCSLNWGIGEIKYKPEISNRFMMLSKYDLTLWFSFLKAQIPTLLVSEEEMSNYDKRISDYVVRDSNDNIINVEQVMELLGVYLSIDGRYKSSKSILMCPKRITEVAAKLELSPEDLFTIVYIHELAHAAMDEEIDVVENMYIQDNYYCDFKIDHQYDSNNKSSTFMEESLANMIMLKYIERFCNITGNQSLFNKAKDFVGQQASLYKFGLTQFDADVDWTKWREYKARNDKPNDDLEEWYKYCLENEKPIIEDYFKEYKKIFDELK